MPTCHWCHVMERESFEDEDVAAILNSEFVSVKVDKEERPDIDAVYMEITQAMTGSGGWPMTVLLTPEKNAFFAGTYYPKNSRFGMHGLIEILKEASRRWKSDKNSLLALADGIRQTLDKNVTADGSEPSRRMLIDAFEYYNAVFDEQNGGFTRAPKFPSPHNLMFLMRFSVLEDIHRALSMAEKTLEQMYRGGIFDHIGGGFARYSTDAHWLVPHFEKMLYDNALLTIAYLEAYTISRRDVFRRTAERTLEYIAREMTGNFGEFYSAQDADSAGHEGLFYVWTPCELAAILGTGDGRYWCDWYSVTRSGNFEGKSIPNLLDNPNFAGENLRIDKLNKMLLTHRAGRVSLHKDDKALTSWNALMITAYANAYRTLGKREYLQAAERAAEFIRENLTDSAGGLLVSYRDERAGGNGYLADYAYYIWSLLALYDAAYNPAYLELAIEYAERMCTLFEDPDGGFYMYSETAEQLMTRPKETYDGAVPSGNSAAAYVLARLSALTGQAKWEIRSQRQLSFMAAVSRDYPAGHSFYNIAAMTALYPQRLLVCATASLGDVSKLREVTADRFMPDLSILVVTAENRECLIKILPSAEIYAPINGETAFYICKGNTCSAPFTGFDKLEQALDGSIAADFLM